MGTLGGDTQDPPDAAPPDLPEVLPRGHQHAVLEARVWRW